jgi:hypothetical protein
LRVLFWNLAVLTSTTYEEGNFFRAWGGWESVNKRSMPQKDVEEVGALFHRYFGYHKL